VSSTTVVRGGCSRNCTSHTCVRIRGTGMGAMNVLGSPRIMMIGELKATMERCLIPSHRFSQVASSGCRRPSTFTSFDSTTPPVVGGALIYALPSKFQKGLRRWALALAPIHHACCRCRPGSGAAKKKKALFVCGCFGVLRALRFAS